MPKANIFGTAEILYMILGAANRRREQAPGLLGPKRPNGLKYALLIEESIHCKRGEELRHSRPSKDRESSVHVTYLVCYSICADISFATLLCKQHIKDTRDGRGARPHTLAVFQRSSPSSTVRLYPAKKMTKNTRFYTNPNFPFNEQFTYRKTGGTKNLSGMLRSVPVCVGTPHLEHPRGVGGGTWTKVILDLGAWQEASDGLWQRSFSAFSP